MKNFREQILEVARDANLSTREEVKLRILLRFKRELLVTEIMDQAQAAGVVPLTATLDSSTDVAEFDFAAFADFIKEILPTILQLISLFL